MAPEQIRGSRDVTALCDEYALGAILYECGTGRTPFWSEDRYELMHGIMTAQVVPPSQRSAIVDPAFDAIVLRALARDPAERFPHVSALGAALWPLASEKARERWAREFGSVEGGLKSSGVAVTVPPPSKDASRKRGRMALGTAGALGVVALAGASILAAAGLARHPGPVDVPPRQSAAAATRQTPATPPAAETTSLAPLAPPVAALSGEAPAAASPRAMGATPPARPVRSLVAAPARRDPQRAAAAAAASVERGTANIPIVE
jgi:serine/threonine-protein kinase